MGDFDVVGDLWVEKGVLRASFGLENTPEPQPWAGADLEDVSTGPWNETADRVYAGEGNGIACRESVRMTTTDRRWLSTRHVGFDFVGGPAMLQAVDVVPDWLKVNPAEHVYTLVTPGNQTLTFIPSTGIWNAVKTWRGISGEHVASGVSKLAGRFVFDLWVGRYSKSRASLE
jgi:hypothetical protein